MGNAQSSEGASESKYSPRNAKVSESSCPVRSESRARTPSSSSASKKEDPCESACPVRTKKENSSSAAYKNPDVYNVYNQKLDPKNNMPSNANQKPSTDQTVPLVRDRVKSTIPKGGTDNDTWQYPSPQMFWNALVRKEKQEGANEEDIDSVVAVHNNMNENTWKQVLVWEGLQGSDPKDGTCCIPGSEPKLLRFLGRPDDLSPRAYLKSLFGYPKPFDRHDWFVDRGGKEVRYIIDYYHDERYEGKDQKPIHMHDTKSVKSIIVEVRPAIDSIEAILNRVFVMPYQLATKNARVQDYVDVPFFPQKDMLHAEEEKIHKLNMKWSQIQSNCHDKRIALEKCISDEECSIATINLQKCTASIVCPEVVAHFDHCVQNSSSSNKKDPGFALEQAYSKIVKCLEMFEIESRNELEGK